MYKLLIVNLFLDLLIKAWIQNQPNNERSLSALPIVALEASKLESQEETSSTDQQLSRELLRLSDHGDLLSSHRETR